MKQFQSLKIFSHLLTFFKASPPDDIMDFFTRIAEHTPQLNKNDNELLSYCIRNHTEIANLKVTELADRLFISPASVVRICKKLGFSGDFYSKAY